MHHVPVPILFLLPVVIGRHDRIEMYKIAYRPSDFPMGQEMVLLPNLSVKVEKSFLPTSVAQVVVLSETHVTLKQFRELCNDHHWLISGYEG